MKLCVLPLLIGFLMDLLIGDPHGFPHPVIIIGREISLLESLFRRLFPKTRAGETAAGGFLWIITAFLAFSVPYLLLKVLSGIHPALRIAVESVMCWQILAARALRDESMKVLRALKAGNLDEARHAVSMIVGRDTERLDAAGITRAAVETVAENTSDGVIAPLFFLVLGGAPAGFLYKAINTMDSMLGYTDPPYTNIGMIPARADDIANFIPARLAALLMLAAGWVLRLDVKSGWRVFLRDRYKHASPNSAQTESVCAGLLGLQLAGDAWYHGVLHKKQTIGDPLREIEPEDIARACSLLYVSSVMMLVLSCLIRGALC